MRKYVSVSGVPVRALLFVLLAAFVIGSVSAASAQTSVTLTLPETQVWYATVRGGSYADTNLATILETRSSSNVEYRRRALLTFDTDTTIAEGTAVSSALLSVTVKQGSGDATRRIGVYQVTTSWEDNEVTYNHRRAGTYWNTAGGDLGTKLTEQIVSNIAGARVTFDITPIVQQAVKGALGASRYTRIALVDLDASTRDSWRAYHTPSDPNTATRPTLTLTYGGTSSTTTSTTATTTSPSTTSGGTTLRVVHWNIHHNGVGMDGKLDMDRVITWVAKFQPDVVSLNEVHRNSGYCSCDAPARFTQMLAAKTGRTWYYKFSTKNGSTNGEGNLLLSRFPFDAAGTKLLSYTRSIVNGTIIVNGRSVNVFSTHLDADSTSRRLTQISELKSWAAGIAEQRIVAGDFNAWPSTTENAEMKEKYRDSWAVAKTAGTATAYPGNEDGKTRGSRIDYIYYSQTASNLVLKSAQVFDTRDANGVMPSDHRPLVAEFLVQ
jgi:endonuclease/exonuclease/phosphatase family metal-dependent hydrolase